LRDEFGKFLFTVFRRRMGAEKFGGSFAADFGHFLPQGDGRARVVTSLGCQLDTDAIRFGFRCTAVGPLDGQGGGQRSSRQGQ
jgi:hypothetical protein